MKALVVRGVVHDVVDLTDEQMGERYPPALVAEFVAVPDGMAGVAPGWTFDGTAWAAPVAFVPPAPPTRWYVPLALARERAQAEGKWDAFAAALDSLPPADRWHLLSLQEGIANDDPQALALLQAVGLDPAVILARVTA